MSKLRQFTLRALQKARSLAGIVEAQLLQTVQSLAAPQGLLPAAASRGKEMGLAFLIVAALLVSSIASAFTAPAAGDFGYDVYDIVVNQILNGPIGFIGGLFLIVFGATQIMKNWVMTILCIIAGTVLIRAEALVVTLGAMVH